MKQIVVSLKNDPQGKSLADRQAECVVLRGKLVSWLQAHTPEFKVMPPESVQQIIPTYVVEAPEDVLKLLSDEKEKPDFVEVCEPRYVFRTDG